MDDDDKLIHDWIDKPCSVCGYTDPANDFVLYGVDKKEHNKIKICCACNSYNWISTYLK